MSTVFLDSVGLIALWNTSDQWHAPAQQAYSTLRTSRLDFVTTRYVLLERGNAVARTALRAEVTRLRMSLANSGKLIDPTEDDWKNAWIAYDNGKLFAATGFGKVHALNPATGAVLWTDRKSVV